jgi:hypothetical protein
VADGFDRARSPYQRIDDAPEAWSMAELGDEWRVIAYQLAPGVWKYLGSLGIGRDNRLMAPELQKAIGSPRGEPPKVSVVQSRVDGTFVLYARRHPHWEGKKP